MVLLVDDDPEFLQHAERVLTEAGIRVLPACDGAAAVAAVRSIPQISLVVLDLDLPDIPGLQVLMNLREIRSDLEIVAMSGVLPDYIIEIAAYLGAAATFAKPITSEWVKEIKALRARAGTTPAPCQAPTSRSRV